MTRTVCLALVLITSGFGRELVVLAGDNTCVQQGALVTNIPFAVDTAKIMGAVLSPYPGDLAKWTVKAGKWARQGTYCDPEGDPVAVEIITAPAGVTVEWNAVDSTWLLQGTLPVGVHHIAVRAVDQPARKWCLACGIDVAIIAEVCPVCGEAEFEAYEPKEARVTVLVNAVRAVNEGPRLN